MNLTSNLLSIINLSKTYYTKYGETKTIDKISFDINDGDFIGIIGPSGCGKSTILNIISNIEKDYEGQIRSLKNIKIGYMLQEHALFPWLSIKQNALLGLKITNNLSKENISYVDNLLKKYDLYEFKDKYPSELSGGMKQRLALIRTIATNPDILLLDEPFCALDYQTRLKVSDDVYNIIKAEKKTVLIVTHDISEAVSMCDKIIVLSKRPAKIKNIYDILLSDKSSPIKNRKSKEFSIYYDILYKEIDS